VRNYLKRHKTLQSAVEEAIEFNLDLAETKLLKAIDNSTPWAIVFYLKTKGRQRGYVERVGYVNKPAPWVQEFNARGSREPRVRNR
jgi:hypothetical protein